MLTYKLISNNDSILIYKYFPYGKDVKIEGGEVLINASTKEYEILRVAELDIKENITLEEKIEIINHINSLRKEGGHPLLTFEEFNKTYIEYIFAEKLIYEILSQIKRNIILEKGIVR